MATKLNPQQIQTQAQRHDDTKDDIDRQLNELKGEVDSLLQASESAATRALSTTTDNWIESVRKSVLAHMGTMAEAIRNESQGQDFADQESMDEILKLPMETGNFLGVS
jgi:uncharacterized protein YukE